MANYGKETVVIFEIDQPQCVHDYGAGACQAALGVTGGKKCFRTRVTCQDTANYSTNSADTMAVFPGLLQLRFSYPQDGLKEFGQVIPSIQTYDSTALAVNLAGMNENQGPLGSREVLNITLTDHKHSDLRVDPYRLERHSGAAQVDVFGIAVAGSSNTLTLALDSNDSDDFFNLQQVTLGDGRVSIVSDYVGATRVATVSPLWSENHLLWSNQLSVDETEWSGTSDLTLSANPADWTIGDTGAGTGASASLSQQITIPADTTDWVASVRMPGQVKVNFCAFSVSIASGETNVMLFNPNDGSFIAESGSTTGDMSVTQDGDDWILAVTVTNTNQTTLTVRFHPQYGALPLALSSESDTLSGSVIAKNFQLENTSTVGEYVETGSAAVLFPSGGESYSIGALSGTGYDPYERSTFWTKWLARNPYFVNYRCRIYEGFEGQSLAQMRVRNFVIDNITGPDDGVVQIVAKDLLSLMERQKAVAPFASLGDLNAGISAAATSLVLSPSGIGADYGSGAITIAIGDEVMTGTLSTDTVSSLTRGAVNTIAETHDIDDTVQLVLVYSSELAVDIIYDLLLNYTSLKDADLPKADWDNATADLVELYSAHIAEPVPVIDLVGELCLQAGLTLWPDLSTGEIHVAQLRPKSTVATLNNDAWLVADTLQLERQKESRVSQLWVYYGQKSPLVGLEEKTNYHSRIVTLDLASESDVEHGTPAVREIFSRWIPQFGRSQGETAGERIVAMFRDPPIEATFDLDVSREGQIEIADYFNLEIPEIVDDVGLIARTTMAAVSITHGEFKSTVQCQQVRFGDFTATNERVIYLENNFANMNLRTLHDGLYSAPLGGSPGEVIRFVVPTGFVIYASAVSMFAMDTGFWPEGVQLILENSGYIQGAGGAGGNGYDPATFNGSAGGPALKVRVPMTIDNTSGQIWAGGGGGGGGEIFSNAGVVGAGGGGGGAGFVGGAGGIALGGIYFSGQPGAAGTRFAGGAGGVGVPGFVQGSGGNGGGPGLVGLVGQSGNGLPPYHLPGNGGAGGNYIVGNSFVNWAGVGDRRGGVA